MDSLIEQLRNFRVKTNDLEWSPIVCLKAADKIEELHAENAEMEKQLNEFSEFLCHMTGNLLSKTNYTAQAMISAAEDYQQRVCDACDEDFLFPDLPIKQAPAGGRGGHLMGIEKLLRAAKDAIDGAMELYGVADDPYIAFQIGAAWAYINAAMGLEGEDDGH